MSEALWQLSDEQLLAELNAAEARDRAAHAHKLALIAELASRDATAKQGYPKLSVFLQDMLRISRREAERRVQQAAAVCSSTAVSGGTQPPALPATAVAAQAGVIGSEHIDTIQSALAGLPDSVGPQEREQAEQILVTAAASLDPMAVAQLGRKLQARLDPDGPEPTETDKLYPRRELQLHRFRDGRLAGRFTLDPEAAALLDALLSPFGQAAAAGRHRTGPRATTERQGEALVDILHLAAESNDVPSEGGERPQVVVTISLDELRSKLGRR